MAFHSKQFTFIFVLVVIFCLAAQQAKSEFLRTGPNTHQSADGVVKVIHVPSSNVGTPGIFIYVGPSIDLQFFTPKELTKKKADHIFIAYDARHSRYSELYLGERSFSIHGSFTLFLKDLRITVDEQADSPYLSLARDNPTEEGEPAILGFKGVTPIVNSVGDKAIALLEARSLSTVSRAVAPYEVSFPPNDEDSGKLLIKGREVTTGRIGLALGQEQNGCLQKSSLFLSERELQTLKKITSRTEKAQYLKRLIRNGTATYLDLYDDLLFLRVTKEMVVAFDHQSNRVYVLKPISEGTSQKQSLCTVHPVELS